MLTLPAPSTLLWQWTIKHTIQSIKVNLWNMPVLFIKYWVNISKTWIHAVSVRVYDHNGDGGRWNRLWHGFGTDYVSLYIIKEKHRKPWCLTLKMVLGVEQYRDTGITDHSLHSPSHLIVGLRTVTLSVCSCVIVLNNIKQKCERSLNPNCPVWD